MKYVVYGLGISGLSTAKFLAKNGEDVVATDDNEKVISDVKTSFEKGGGLIAPAIKTEDFIKKNPNSLRENHPSSPAAMPPFFSKRVTYDTDTIISFAPGIPLHFPKPHKILEICKKTGATLACDIEIFYRKNRDANFIAITGTNGKSTTTALSGFIFKELGISAEIGGNIGVPCFDLPTSENYIFETSSYQLDLLSQTHFHIAALLNITPDHLDRHGSMAGYIEAKKRIFRNQTEKDFALIDIDNENSRKVFDELKADKNFRATLVPISTKKIQENGVALFGGKLVNKIGGENSELELKSEFLRGEHNDQNMAFAFTIAWLSQIADQNKIVAAIKKFRGLRHRMQIVGKIGEIKFINDSKATNAESTEHALKAYENIFWILGGKAKDGGISTLQPYFKKIRKAFLIGEATEEFAQILEKNSVDFEKCGDLKTAFEKAFSDAKKSSLTEKNVLLSPACASFDQWKNFEQRGDYFCKLFDELPKS